MGILSAAKMDQGLADRMQSAYRVFAFTRLNAHSSRSHAIVMLTIIKRRRTLPGQEAGPLQKVKIGKLFMVDLAGSERLKKSMSTGMHRNFGIMVVTSGMWFSTVLSGSACNLKSTAPIHRWLE